jgi:hypothetical protein
MAGMTTVSRIALWFGACVAAVLAVLAALAILNIWFLVPLDPALTQGQAIRIKLGYMALFAVAFFLFGGLSRLAFRKVRQKTE